ncbi:MAG: zinc ribbon domain-containing protein [Desulfomicrobium sp.]|nr:zinc ribbon domain-containing protein [Desulfomicrobium sp.]
MPIYEFKCGNCGMCFEEILPASHKHNPSCPRCKTDKDVEKLLSASLQHSAGASSPASGCAPRGGFS